MIPSGPGALSGFDLRSAAATSSFVIRMGQSGVSGYVYPTMSLRSASGGRGKKDFFNIFAFSSKVLAIVSGSWVVARGGIFGISLGASLLFLPHFARRKSPDWEVVIVAICCLKQRFFALPIIFCFLSFALT